MRRHVCILFAVGSLFSVQNVASAQDAGVDIPSESANRGMTKRSQSIFHPNNVLPDKVQALKITHVSANNLTVSWQKPNAQHAADLAGYHVTINQQAPIALARDVDTFTFSPLVPAARYTITVTPINPVGNEGESSSVSTVSLLVNPSAVNVMALDRQALLHWQPSSPYQFVSAYKVYVSDSPFASVDDVAPYLTVNSDARQAVLMGLTNDRTYHIGVSVVNSMGLENPAVQSVAVIPQVDQQGPEITDVFLDGIPLTALDNNVVADGRLTVEVNDPSGVSVVNYRLSSRLNHDSDKRLSEHSLGQAFQPASDFERPLVVDKLEDGEYALTVIAQDSLDNTTTLTYPLHVLKNVPDAPAIISPPPSEHTRHPMSSVVVAAHAHQAVQLVVNGEALPWQKADARGQSRLTVALTNGLNTVVAYAKNRAGKSEPSSSVGIVLDPNIPPQPTGVVATAHPKGRIALQWQPYSGRKTVTYNLYRSAQPFTDADTAEKLNTYPITQSVFDDVPPLDGHYYYRVEPVSMDGRQGELSSQVVAVSDRTLPMAQAVLFEPVRDLPKLYDGMSTPDLTPPLLGPGRVKVTLLLNEPVATIPYLAIQAEGKSPLGVVLSPVDTIDADEFVGELVIPEGYHAGDAVGEANVLFSARDQVGNRGTDVAPESAHVQIDTAGPVVKDVEFYTTNPIKNDPDQPAVLRFAVEMNEPLGIPPVFALQRAKGDALPVTSLAQQSATRWLASYTLPPSLGYEKVDVLRLTYQATDTLGNTQSGYLQPAEIEVYQGELPALAIPTIVSATSQAKGQVALGWQPVEQAAGYAIYRRGINDEAMTRIAEVSASAQTEDHVAFTDTVPADGRYVYAVVSVRQPSTDLSQARSSQAQSSKVQSSNTLSGIVSEHSEEVVVDSDSQAPNAPYSLTATLQSDGVHVQWVPNTETDNGVEMDSRYRVYRQAGDEFTALADAALITHVAYDSTLGHITNTQAIVDRAPLVDNAVYVVTALDAAGNESAPSVPVFFHAPILPVNNVVITQRDKDAPVIRWQHPNDAIEGFEVRLAAEHKTTPLNTRTLTQNHYTDVGFERQARTYQLVALDDNGQQSLVRGVTLPYVTISLTDTKGPRSKSLQRGVMNLLSFDVQSDAEIENAQLHVTVAGKTYRSVPFAVTASNAKAPTATVNAPVTVTVPVVGHTDWQATENVSVSLVIQPSGGDRVDIQRTFIQAVTDSRYVLTLDSKNTVRGETAQVRFQLENDSALPIILDTAAVADAVTFSLYDSEDNVLTTTAWSDASLVKASLQNTAQTAALMTKADQPTTSITIAANSTFTSPWVAMRVPDNAPDNAILDVAIASLIYRPFYHPSANSPQEEPLGAELAGMSHRQAVSTVLPAYYAELHTVTPTIAYGGQPITLEGEVRDSHTHERVPNASLQMVFDIDGFEKTVTLASDINGMFRYQYQPTAQESGRYRFSIIHPTSTDRPDQGGFHISRLHPNVTAYSLLTPRNETAEVAVTLRNPLDVDYDGVYWHVDGILPTGITLNAPAPTYVAGLSEMPLPIQFTANAHSAERGTLPLQLRSSMTGDKALASVTLDYTLGQKTPTLFYSPSQIETGVTTSGTVSETVQLENHGHGDMKNVNVQLLAQDNSPASGWITLNGASTLGDIAPGERVGVSVTLSPQNQLRPRVYHYKLRVTCNNYPVRDIPIIALVSAQQTGGMQFKVDNLYSGSLDANGNIIRGKADALVRLQHVDLPSVQYDAVTDDAGEIFLPKMQHGQYRYVISAPHHDDKSGEIHIAPSIVRNFDVFLDYQTTSMGWAANTVSSTSTSTSPSKDNAASKPAPVVFDVAHETDVPAAVVVMSPSSIALPDLQAGDVVYGELTLTNHGLLPAENVSLALPPSDEYVQFSFLPSAIPSSLAPKAQVTIPYRVVSLKTRHSNTHGDPRTESSCSTYAHCTLGTYRFTSTLSVTRQAEAKACFITSPAMNSTCDFQSSRLDSLSDSATAQMPFSTLPFDTPFGWYGTTFGNHGGNEPRRGDLPNPLENNGMPGCRNDGETCQQRGNGAAD
ncbi:fibronectin type III domain-containing protein [Photobacterium japonica]|uniref:fibronectin type III domain-containing protein n=1 Tax=Photobacterium japonica TaxID=2910235 RepID=UPI003D11FF62